MMGRNKVSDKIAVSVIVVTRNEAVRIERCLAALRDFSEVIVVDSGSEDSTCDVARACGARVVDFAWNGAYPKKRQWCLDHLELAHDWVFFVDADEIVDAALVAEIAALRLVGDGGARDNVAGYFVRGEYVWRGQVLRHGLCNNKLCLIDRRRVAFPVVDDLDCSLASGGMGEIEGHYQPVLKAGHEGAVIGQLACGLRHEACEDVAAWEARHLKYAAWEAAMDARAAWPRDPVLLRRVMKRVFKALPFRGEIAFLHSYVLKAGFLDGAAGLCFACSRMKYYRMIRDCKKLR